MHVKILDGKNCVLCWCISIFLLGSILFPYTISFCKKRRTLIFLRGSYFLARGGGRKKHLPVPYPQRICILFNITLAALIWQFVFKSSHSLDNTLPYPDWENFNMKSWKVLLCLEIHVWSLTSKKNTIQNMYILQKAA